MTIAQAFNEITTAQGGTPDETGTITGALDALTDALAGSDQPAPRTIEDGVRMMGEHIGGGGGGGINPPTTFPIYILARGNGGDFDGDVSVWIFADADAAETMHYMFVGDPVGSGAVMPGLYTCASPAIPWNNATVALYDVDWEEEPPSFVKIDDVSAIIDQEEGLIKFQMPDYPAIADTHSADVIIDYTYE